MEPSSSISEGLLVAVGMCGQGLMLGPGVGELVTRKMLDDLTASDYEILEILSLQRVRRVRKVEIDTVLRGNRNYL